MQTPPFKIRHALGLLLSVFFFPFVVGMIVLIAAIWAVHVIVRGDGPDDNQG